MRTSSDIIKFCVSAGISALVGKRVLNCLWELTYRCTAKCAICGYWQHANHDNGCAKTIEGHFLDRTN